VAALALAAGCRSAFDVQVESAIARARAEDEHARARYAAERLAEPAWWQGPPIAVPTETSRVFAAGLVGRALRGGADVAAANVAVSEAVSDGEAAPVAVDVVGPRGRVRVTVHGGEGLARARVAELLVDAGASVALEAVSTPSARAPTDAPIATVVVAPPRAGAALVLALRSRDDVERTWLAIVAACALFDAATAVGAGAPLAVLLPATALPAAPACGEILVEAGPADAELALAVAFGTAAALADARATELERYLIALDGEYQMRTLGQAHDELAPLRVDPAEWHRAVRAALRRACLGLAGDEPGLDAPLR
jgi:hypothetical protein